jgi:hypothetical protein
MLIKLHPIYTFKSSLLCKTLNVDVRNTTLRIIPVNAIFIKVTSRIGDPIKLDVYSI